MYIYEYIYTYMYIYIINVYTYTQAGLKLRFHSPALLCLFARSLMLTEVASYTRVQPIHMRIYAYTSIFIRYIRVFTHIYTLYMRIFACCVSWPVQ